MKKRLFVIFFAVLFTILFCLPIQAASLSPSTKASAANKKTVIHYDGNPLFGTNELSIQNSKGKKLKTLQFYTRPRLTLSKDLDNKIIITAEGPELKKYIKCLLLRSS